MALAPRGIRNNNPGNIRHGDNWNGQKSSQTDISFIQFKSPEWGIRAMAKLLLNYESIYGLNTVAGIIGRWAPSSENNTSAYILAVSRKLGVDPNEPFSVRGKLVQLVKAIIKHENGIQPYADFQINGGIRLI
ncbi:MAG: structural protein [Robiginitomaculum sp.]|nr:MAG: structural protein [Robiginitomaculum sp.]